jgi:hypothetical protein
MNWVERILRGLQDHDVEFIVVRMMAATFQNSPLRTEDIDICPEPSVANLRRLASALNDLGAQGWEPHKSESSSGNGRQRCLPWIPVAIGYRR